MVVVTNRCGLLRLLDIIENDYSSGFRCNRIQTIPGIEFPCGNWILRSIRVNTVLYMYRAHAQRCMLENYRHN